jgi:hypothetical protein
MKLFVPLTLAAAFLLAGNCPGEPPAAKDDGKPFGPPDPAAKQVEVRFANGSTVLMYLLQDSIEIVTEFGKLKIPPAEIRQIDFGLHLTDSVRAEIERALQQLASANYKEREAATKRLVDLGPLAYLALYQTTKSKDQEAAKRAQAAMKTVAQKVPERLLRLREEDRIRTTKFTVVGRIVTPFIKARAEYFGDLSLRPTQLLAIRWMEGTGSTEVVVDAAKYGSAADQWMDTGITIEPHVRLKATATGQVDIWPQQGGQYISGPAGLGQEAGVPVRFVNGRAPQGRAGALMGRIGEGGTPFVIGERHTQVPTTEGKLYLHITPGPWGGGSNGNYRVKIFTGPGAEDND